MPITGTCPWINVKTQKYVLKILSSKISWNTGGTMLYHPVHDFDSKCCVHEYKVDSN